MKHNKIIGIRKYKNVLRLLIYEIYLLFKFFCKCTQFITTLTICLSIIFKYTSILSEKFLKLFAVKPLNRFRRLFSQVLIFGLDHFSDLVLYCCDMVGLAWSLHLDNLWTGKHYPSLGLVYKQSWQLLKEEKPNPFLCTESITATLPIKPILYWSINCTDCDAKPDCTLHSFKKIEVM